MCIRIPIADKINVDIALSEVANPVNNIPQLSIK
jgi:hypothetical protein